MTPEEWTGKTGQMGKAWLMPGLGAVLLLAGGFGWWAAPTDEAVAGGVVAAATVGPQAPVTASTTPRAVGVFGQAALNAGALPGGDDLASARAPDRKRRVLSDEEREARRFGRYDRDRNGGVDWEEFLASRRKAFRRLDRNGDGRLSFEEYADTTIVRFETADRNADRTLSRTEFAATATRRAGAGVGTGAGAGANTGAAGRR